MRIITSGLNPNEDHICHYGVKGMRWGQHLFGIRHINKLRKTPVAQQLQQQQLLQQQTMQRHLMQQQQQLAHQQVHQQMMNMHMHTQMQQQMTALGAHYVAMGMM